MQRLKKDSRKYGTVADEIDLALLVDGLEAEREQGITIDVAYRFFSTENGSLLLLIRLGMNSIRVIWQPGRQRQI